MSSGYRPIYTYQLLECLGTLLEVLRFSQNKDGIKLKDIVLFSQSFDDEDVNFYLPQLM